MSYKGIVLSLKKGDKVVSWEADRTPSHLIHVMDESFFAAPELSDLFKKRASAWRHPALGDLDKRDPVPGSVGWIGLDLDRRWIIDIQGMQEMDTCFSYLRDTPLVLPAGVKQACGRSSFTWWHDHYHQETIPFQNPPIRSEEDWAVFLQKVTGQHQYVSQLAIRPELPPGWRLFNAETVLGEKAGAAVSKAFVRLERAGWSKALLPHRGEWEDFLTSYYNLPGGPVRGWLDRRRAAELEVSLPPPVEPARGFKPRF